MTGIGRRQGREDLVPHADDLAHLGQQLRGGPQRCDHVGQGPLRRAARSAPRSRRPSAPSRCPRAPRPAPTDRVPRATHPDGVPPPAARRPRVPGCQRQTVRWSGGSCTSSSRARAVVESGSPPWASPRSTVARPARRPSSGRRRRRGRRGGGGGRERLGRSRRHRALDRAVAGRPGHLAVRRDPAVVEPRHATDSGHRPGGCRVAGFHARCPPGCRFPAPASGTTALAQARSGQGGGQDQGGHGTAAGRGASGRSGRRHPAIPPPVVARGDRSGVRWVPPAAPVAPRGAPTPPAPLGSPTDHFPAQPTDSEDGSPRGSLRVPGP